MTTVLQQLHASAKRTSAVDTLWFQIQAAQLPGIWVREFRFHALRRWRFDIAERSGLGSGRGPLAIEVDGGLYLKGKKQGAHSRGAGREKDYERDAEAMIYGWRVLRCSPRQVKEGKALLWIEKLLEAGR